MKKAQHLKNFDKALSILGKLEPEGRIIANFLLSSENGLQFKFSDNTAYSYRPTYNPNDKTITFYKGADVGKFICNIAYIGTRVIQDSYVPSLFCYQKAALGSYDGKFLSPQQYFASQRSSIRIAFAAEGQIAVSLADQGKKDAVNAYGEMYRVSNSELYKQLLNLLGFLKRRERGPDLLKAGLRHVFAMHIYHGESSTLDSHVLDKYYTGKIIALLSFMAKKVQSGQHQIFEDTDFVPISETDANLIASASGHNFWEFGPSNSDFHEFQWAGKSPIMSYFSGGDLSSEVDSILSKIESILKGETSGVGLEIGTDTALIF